MYIYIYVQQSTRSEKTDLRFSISSRLKWEKIRFIDYGVLPVTTRTALSVLIYLFIYGKLGLPITPGARLLENGFPAFPSTARLIRDRNVMLPTRLQATLVFSGLYLSEQPIRAILSVRHCGMRVFDPMTYD